MENTKVKVSLILYMTSPVESKGKYPSLKRIAINLENKRTEQHINEFLDIPLIDLLQITLYNSKRKPNA